MCSDVVGVGCGKSTSKEIDDHSRINEANVLSVVGFLSVKVKFATLYRDAGIHKKVTKA